MLRTLVCLILCGLILPFSTAVAEEPAPSGGLGREAAIETLAVTTPYLDLTIAFEVPGIIDNLFVKEGDRVKTGMVLAQLRSDLLSAQLDVARGRIEEAGVVILSTQATYDTRKIEFNRSVALLNRGVNSPDAHDKVKLEMELARLAVIRAKTEKKVSELDAVRIETALRQTVVRAPRDALVHRVFKNPGEAVDEYQPVLRLVCVDPLFVVTHVPAVKADRLESGVQAILRLENADPNDLTCVVSVVDHVADPASGTYRVKLTLPNPDGRLSAGMKGTLTFRLP